jgi:hypothetical protein
LKKKEKGTTPKVGPRNTDLPEELLWLADAPLFIDDRRVEALYDAMFRPDYGETPGAVAVGALEVARAGVAQDRGHLRHASQSGPIKALVPLSRADPGRFPPIRPKGKPGTCRASWKWS